MNVASFISTLPAGTQRVRIKDLKGEVLYRKLEDLTEDDEPVMSAQGTPVVIKGNPAAKKQAPNVPSAPPIAPQPVVVPAGVPAVIPTSTAVAVMTGKPPIVVVNNTLTKEDLEVIQVNELRTIRKKRHGTDNLIKEVRKNPSGDAVFDSVMTSLSEEAELIEFERDRLIQANRPYDHITEQRLRVLKAVADAWLKRKMKSGGGIDLDSPEFNVVAGFMLETFRGAMEDAGVRPEFIETIFAKLSKRLTENWKDEARMRIKDKGIVK